MFKKHLKFLAVLQYLTDMAVTVVSFFVAIWLRSYLPYVPIGQLNQLHSHEVESYLWLFLVINPVWTVLFLYFNAHKSFRSIRFIGEIKVIGKVVVIGGLSIGTISFVLHAYDLSRVFILLFVVVNFIFLSLERLIVRRLSLRAGVNDRSVLIVGTNRRAAELADTIERHRSWRLRLLGFLSDTPDYTYGKIDRSKIIGDCKDLKAIIDKNVIDDVIFAIPRKRFAELEDIFLMLEEHGINAMVMANFFPHLIARVGLEELDHIPLLTFSTTPTSSLPLFCKRLLDIAASLIVLIISLPVIVLTAILIKLTSPGPIFFKQQRCGLRGRIFTLYKFRSMISDAEARKAELESMNEMGGPVFKIKDDPRITGIGRFIRKASIDELPQLWNVLKGDMSFVGPRPPLPEEVAKYERWQKRRLSMRPGLTCIWQVSGRNKITDFNEWVKLDLQYIDRWSLRLDIKLFLKTIPVVVFRRGAA